jgi:nitrogen regulatory protein P-II 1
MTKIEILTRPSCLEEVKRAVDHPWVSGLTATEVKAYGRAGRARAIYRGAVQEPDMTPMLRVEIVVPDGLAPRILHELERSLRARDPGDGRLHVRHVDEAVRVRTGERGEGAL